jgi:hypothetical protein
MQFNFFALYNDKVEILTHIFKETQFKIFDHYSKPGEELREYKSVEEIALNYDLSDDKTNSVHLALWNLNYGETNIIRRVDLNPKYCDGHTFRYAATGWSLQQLYLNGVSEGRLDYSTLKGFTEKGALEKDSYNPPPDRKAHLLDWPKIRSDQRKLKSFIEKKLTARKINTYLILKAANFEIQNGFVKL